ncbi:MAG: thioester reductase domain-containing protein, partial [Nannocystaceae bacterium]
LTRHPHAVVDSYARIGLHRLRKDAVGEGRDAYALGEMGWTVSNQTVLKFLAEVDASRVCRLRFEELVSNPEPEMQRLLEFLGVPWSGAVLAPYTHGKMVDTTDSSALVGDPNFARRTTIDPSLADVWQAVSLPRPLGRAAQEVAQQLGYTIETSDTHANGDGVSDVRAAEIREATLSLLAAAAKIERQKFDDTTPISDLGLGSLQRIRLTDALEQALGRPLDAMTLYNHPTVGELISHFCGQPSLLAAPVDPKRSFGAGFDLESEVVLDPDITAHAPAATGDGILLTGATGFLGAYLLAELVAEPRARVVCLVRADAGVDPMTRVQANLERYGLWRPAYSERVAAVRGDLAEPRLGLAASTYRQLTSEISSIVHNGAQLRFDLPYGPLHAANVAGTEALLRFATEVTTKRLTYVSTIAVLDALPHRGRSVNEDTSLSSWSGVRLGYAQTKWVAERLVSLAGTRGVPVTIVRPGGVAGHSQTGAWNTGDLICRILKGCILVGAAPRLAFDVDMAPVDYVARGVAHLARQSSSVGGVYHLNHPHPMPWRRLVAWLQFRGYELGELDYGQWLTRVRESVTDEGHPLAPLVPFLSARLDDDRTLFEARESRPRVACEQTCGVLGQVGLTCPQLGHELFTTWFEAMIVSGFLPRPQGPAW